MHEIVPSARRPGARLTSLYRQVRTLVLAGLSCLLASACTPTAYDFRPASHGFDATSSGVPDAYDDGKRQLANGRAGLAIERFRQALAEDRGSINALNGLAVAYAKLGRTQLAETYLQRALDLRHDDVATLNNYGRLLIEQGRSQEAREMLMLAELSAVGSEYGIVEANLAAIDTPRKTRPYHPATSESPLRLAKLDMAVYRLETGTATVTGTASLAVASGPEMPAAMVREPAHDSIPAEQPVAAPATPSTPSRPSRRAFDPFVIVANGVGRTGLAAEWRERLSQNGVKVDSLANANPFKAVRTEIRYHPLFADEANDLAASLSISPTLVADSNAPGDIYVELGPDSLEIVGGSS